MIEQHSQRINYKEEKVSEFTLDSNKKRMYKYRTLYYNNYFGGFCENVECGNITNLSQFGWSTRLKEYQTLDIRLFRRNSQDV